MREEELVSQLTKIIDQLDINEIGIKKQFEEEVERYGKFRQIVLQMNGKEYEISKEQKVDLRSYAKYILKQGTMTEKREILSCTKSRLIFKDKQLTLEKNETALKTE